MLPKNCTIVMQPLDVGVFGPFKKKLSYLNITHNPFKLKTAKEKRLKAIERTMEAFDSISSDIIKRSFSKTIFANIENRVTNLLV